MTSERYSERQVAMQTCKLIDQAVMNEQPVLVAKWMTIGSLHRRARRRPNVRQEHWRFDLRSQRLQVCVVPRGPDIRIDTGHISFAVPADTKPITVGGVSRVRCSQALVDQGVVRK